MALFHGLSLATVVSSAVLASSVYFIFRLVQHRRFYQGLPKPPHDFLWGHLRLVGETMSLLPAKVHFHLVVATISQKYDLPGLWYLDLWPFGPSQLIITDPDVALHITVAKDYPKHDMEKLVIDPVAGDRNIVSTNGPYWKYLHRMLAPAFAVSHIRSMVGMMAEEAMTFRSVLHELATAGETFSLEEISTNLTFDVIAKSIFGHSLEAQTKACPALNHFSDICHHFAIERESFNPLVKLFHRMKRMGPSRKLNTVITQLIQERFEVLRRDNVDVSKKRGLSIIDLVLREHLEEVRTSGVQALNSKFIAVAIAQIRTLLLAGTATTSDGLVFTYMFLSKHPEVVSKLREEHDGVFTPGIEATYSLLLEHPEKLNELEYTTNVIKETLRLYPIGYTARGPHASESFITYNGQQYSTTGQLLSPVSFAMHMDPRLFPNPSKFDPDRFSRDESPRHAWRPFERGPRACLGQTMSMDEIRIILLLTIREFEFTCADLKPNKTQRVPWFDLDLTYGDRAFQEFVFEAKPRDGMPMTIRKATKS